MIIREENIKQRRFKIIEISKDNIFYLKIFNDLKIRITDRTFQIVKY